LFVFDLSSFCFPQGKLAHTLDLALCDFVSTAYTVLPALQNFVHLSFHRSPKFYLFFMNLCHLKILWLLPCRGSRREDYVVYLLFLKNIGLEILLV
jgi:hypothetical protein